MKLSGAYYPDLMRMACYQVQLDLGCDPDVLRFFTDRFILPVHRPSDTLQVFVAEEHVWKETERVWREAEKRTRNSHPHLH